MSHASPSYNSTYSIIKIMESMLYPFLICIVLTFKIKILFPNFCKMFVSREAFH